ncbi:MAG TPA: zf-TFIIB domain-containing protein [Longimicrobiales bacterium]|jgi:hypothetical protein
MAELEARLPCPVCPGVRMEKQVPGDGALLLDHCPSCGGFWFDRGELARVREGVPGTLAHGVDEALHGGVGRCPHCEALVERSADACPACEKPLLLSCPACGETMERVGTNDLTLDVCMACKGVWVDHGELAMIWTLEVGAALARRGESGVLTDDDADAVGEVLLFAPDLAFYGTGVTRRVAAEAAAAAPDVVVAAGEVASEAASSVFDAIADIADGALS